MIEQGVICRNVDGCLFCLIGFGVFNWVVIWFDLSGVYLFDVIGDLIWQIVMDGVINKGRKVQVLCLIDVSSFYLRLLIMWVYGL